MYMQKMIGKDTKTFIALLYELGYIFPLHPVSEKQIDSQSHFVWQKHWLTYGVYQLINSDITKKENGAITKNAFKEILFNGKKRYITEKGEIHTTKGKQNKK